jgi:hypothetical protein
VQIQLLAPAEVVARVADNEIAGPVLAIRRKGFPVVVVGTLDRPNPKVVPRLIVRKNLGRVSAVIEREEHTPLERGPGQPARLVQTIILEIPKPLYTTNVSTRDAIGVYGYACGARVESSQSRLNVTAADKAEAYEAAKNQTGPEHPADNKSC